MTEDLRENQDFFLPHPKDNCALACRRITQGSKALVGDSRFVLSHTILEGHRFCVRMVPTGSAVTSWNQPFAFAIAKIRPGDYICNEQVLSELRTRELDFSIPEMPNIRDEYQPYRYDPSVFQPPDQVESSEEAPTFSGYYRSASRGVGTRNFIVVMGISSQAASLSEAIAKRTSSLAGNVPGLDGIVAVAHTEGGLSSKPHNEDYLLRTLSGFMVHPNVAAILITDLGDAWITNERLLAYAKTAQYPLHEVLHQAISPRDFQSGVAEGERIIREWVDIAGRTARKEEPVSKLNIALQCGGSDAFSGVTANPLVGSLARKLIACGGLVNLAETTELVGAEHYLLERVSSVETARQFLRYIEEFKSRMSWHGHSPEGNPSGGNRFRGLYNITLKSLGAAMKRDPAVRLDHVIDYAERMSSPGFYFMNSPGNDLESLAGQVASGSTLVFFTTGNGSITNFPFVPTIKVLSTSSRFRLLENDIDVDAGAILRGQSCESLAENLFDLMLEVASGGRTRGELAGHYQVSIWRDWKQTSESNPQEVIKQLEQVSEARKPNPDSTVENTTILSPLSETRTRRWVNLVLPTSLCSSQVASMIASDLAGELRGSSQGVFSVPHTEGCGVSSGHSQQILTRLLVGHLTHPQVATALLLEHGCEKVHNEYLRQVLRSKGIDPIQFGWCSIQADGGIEAARKRVESFFISRLASPIPAEKRSSPPNLAIIVSAPPSDYASSLFYSLASGHISNGGTVIIFEDDPLLRAFSSNLGPASLEPNLRFGQEPGNPGLQVMQSLTSHWLEKITALASGLSDVILALTDSPARQGHVYVPMISVGENLSHCVLDGFDLILEQEIKRDLKRTLDLLVNTLEGSYLPVRMREKNTGFQVARGPLGVSV